MCILSVRDDLPRSKVATWTQHIIIIIIIIVKPGGGGAVGDACRAAPGD